MFGWFKKQPETTAVAAPVPVKKKLALIYQQMISALSAADDKPEIRSVERYTPAPGVIPADDKDAVMAMDSTPYDYINQGFSVDHLFPGYPYLATLAQRPEYRKIVSTIAEEMTRKWINLEYSGDGDATERLDGIKKELERFKIKEAFRQMIEHDGYFGRGQIYIELKTPSGKFASETPDEMASLLTISSDKIKKDSLVALRNIEPIWMYPREYNSTDPTQSDYYKPKTWYVMSKTVHSSRLLTVISQPVPDMFKPSYSFGGLSLVQMAEPYVNNWLSTRDSVKDMIKSFSINGLKTDMQQVLTDAECDGTDLIKRAELFVKMRNNRSLWMLDKEGEDFFQFNTPLSGLSDLQAQAQEHMASVSSIPLVKLLGITPSGLNASSEGEIRVFYDYIASRQEADLRDPLKKVIDIIQLSKFGNIDENVSFSFEPLFQLSELEQAQIRNTDASTDAVLVNAQILTDVESRERLAADPKSPYQTLETGDDLDDGEETA